MFIKHQYILSIDQRVCEVNLQYCYQDFWLLSLKREIASVITLKLDTKSILLQNAWHKYTIHQITGYINTTTLRHHYYMDIYNCLFTACSLMLLSNLPNCLTGFPQQVHLVVVITGSCWSLACCCKKKSVFNLYSYQYNNNFTTSTVFYRNKVLLHQQS